MGKLADIINQMLDEIAEDETQAQELDSFYLNEEKKEKRESD